MYTCYFYIRLTTKDAHVTLERSCEIPFAPCVGHRFIFDDENNDFMDADRVEYSVDGDVFWVTEFRSYGDDCTCTVGDGCCIFDPEHWISDGWKIHDPPRYGHDRYHLEPWEFPSPSEEAASRE